MHGSTRTISGSDVVNHLASGDVVAGTVGYIRGNVLGDGDCGYTALGITRVQAADLLKKKYQ